MGILHRKLEERSQSRSVWAGARFTNGSSINLWDSQIATPNLKITKDILKVKSLRFQKNVEDFRDVKHLV